MAAVLTNLRQKHATNFSAFRKSLLSEISGSLGDLGTLLPLMIALAINNSISLSSTLVFSGLWNILTGAVFGIPLAVQPMKAIAAVAIAQKYSIEETISAGFATSGVVFILSVTGLLQWFTRKIPVPVIKGIQLGAALTLIISSGTTLLQPLHLITPSWHDNLLLALLAFLFLLTTHSPTTKIPYALIIFACGLSLSLFASPSIPTLSLYAPKLYIPSTTQFSKGAINAGLGQIPLTTLNSIIAIPSLSLSLLPHLPPPSVTSIGLSVSLMNLIGGWFGAMPVCHGSGGLAGQYRFGARNGSSIIILGAVKLLLGLTFGESLLGLLKAFPRSLLGVLVVAAGLELAKVGEGLNFDAVDLVGHRGAGSSESERVDGREVGLEERKERWAVMLMTVAGILAFKNDGVGFVVGMLCHFSYGWRRNVETWVTRARSAVRGGGEERRRLLG